MTCFSVYCINTLMKAHKNWKKWANKKKIDYDLYVFLQTYKYVYAFKNQTDLRSKYRF